MENDETIQCLVSWKTFYSNTSSKKYPPILCFPGYFVLMIYTAQNAYLKMEKIINSKSLATDPKDIYEYEILEKIQISKIEQIKRFLSSLQLMVDLIFIEDDITTNIKVKPFEDINSELIRVVKLEMTTKKAPEKEFFLLENYLVDENDRQKYQKALLQTSLKHYNATSIEELIKIFYKQGSCKNIDSTPIPQIPISSIHFIHQLPFSNETNFSKIRRGPRAWGPIYWNIFHALSQNAQRKRGINLMNGYYTEDQISTFLYGYIQYLPLQIPCPICTVHYYQTIHPGKIKFSNNIEDYKNIYDEIHKKVTENKKSSYT